MLAPIVLFTYKRLDTLKQTVSALKNNHLSVSSDLFIFSDASKSGTDYAQVKLVREYIRTIEGFKSVTIIETSKNMGLANSIISGVTQILNEYGKVIVLEDDLKTTPNFLTFMNSCLDEYSNKLEVFSISGYSFNLGISPFESSDSYFLPRGWSWGWATWKNRWDGIDWTVKDYTAFANDKAARKEFAKGGSDLNSMLDKQINGLIDSWAIRWFYYQFKVKGLTVYPVHSKVYNNGFDVDATHTTGSSKRYLPLMDDGTKILFCFPDEIAISAFYQHQFQNKMGIFSRFVSKLDNIKNSILSNI